MLKSAASYILIILGVVALYLSTSKEQMSGISDIRNRNTDWWGAENKVHNGDLINISYLALVKHLCSPADHSFKNYAQNDTTQEVNLYLNGDSYTKKIPAYVWEGVNRYEYAWVYNNHIKYNLDTNKKNILLLEHSERYIRHFFATLDLMLLVYDSTNGSKYNEYKHLLSGHKKEEEHQLLSALFSQEVTLPLFNKNINQNLEYNLFNYNFVDIVRETKALINYELFNRASGDVIVSKNGERLYLKETLAKTGKGSSYSNITDEEYNSIVRHINILYNHYKQEGFDEVYLSLIPNPVSVIEPEKYNQLIPRLQNDSNLHIKFIDYYSNHLNDGDDIFRTGDTHWNNYGMQLWIDQVNDTLARWNTKI